MPETLFFVVFVIAVLLITIGFGISISSKKKADDISYYNSVINRIEKTNNRYYGE